MKRIFVCICVFAITVPTLAQDNTNGTEELKWSLAIKNDEKSKLIVELNDSYAEVSSKHKDILLKSGIKNDNDFLIYKFNAFETKYKHTDYANIPNALKNELNEYGIKNANDFSKLYKGLSDYRKSLSDWGKNPNRGFNNLPEGPLKNNLIAKGINNDSELNKYIKFKKTMEVVQQKKVPVKNNNEIKSDNPKEDKENNDNDNEGDDDDEDDSDDEDDEDSSR